MNQEEKQRISELMAEENLLCFTTMGEQWPTATIQAFAHTPELHVALIMQESSDRFQNIMRRPNVSYLIDNREHGDPTKFQVRRLAVRGIAQEVPRGSQEWEQLKALFLEKNPFEAPFFGRDTLRIVRVVPKQLKYVDGLSKPVVAEL